MPIRVHTGDGPPVSPRARSQPGSRSGLLVGVTGQVIDSIRQVIFLFGPTAPRTQVALVPPLALSGPSGESVRTVLTVHNTQAAVVTVSPALTVLRGLDGTQWLPQNEIAIGQRLLWPGERTTVDVTISISHDVPEGSYDGHVVLFGVDGDVPVRVTVHEVGVR